MLRIYGITPCRISCFYISDLRIISKNITQLHLSHAPDLPFILYLIAAQSQSTRTTLGLLLLPRLICQPQRDSLEVFIHTPLLRWRQTLALVRHVLLEYSAFLLDYREDGQERSFSGQLDGNDRVAD